MARVILVTGGSRSGKSDFARRTAEALPGRRAFVATCPVTDEEMALRIRKHREERSRSNWETIEEPVNIAAVLRDAREFDVFVVDCLTLWINNLLYQAAQQGRSVTEDDIVCTCRDLLQTCTEISGTVIFVTNELGSGIVPESPVARLYRDLVGRCNQIMARHADNVTMVACGLPLNLKERNSI